MPTLDDMKRMADKQAEPLLAKLKTDPKNVDLLNKTALTYKAAHQFKEAISYFQKALDVDPKNVAIRTDMASCMYYTGDVDGALAQLDKSLTYDPKHAGNADEHRHHQVARQERCRRVRSLRGKLCSS